MYRLFLLGVPLLLVAGCSSPKGTVSGKVTHKAKPVTSGTITLIARDGLPYSGPIGADGAYSIPNVPGGDVKIVVSSPNPAGEGRTGGRGGGGLTEAPKGEGPPAPGGKWSPLPDKYADPTQSGLTGKVNGDTTLDVELP